jgi:hypothetical protein
MLSKTACELDDRREKPVLFRPISLFMAFSTDRLPLFVVNIGASRYAHNILYRGS